MAVERDGQLRDNSKTKESEALNFLETKIPPPIVMMLFGFAMWNTSVITPAIELSPETRYFRYLGLGVFAVLGLIGLLSGAISFRLAKTTVNPLKPEEATSLVTSGIYKVTRNPMYVGMVFLLCAWTLYLSSLWATPFIFLFMAYIHRYQIIPEERALIRNFNQEFIVYKARVRAWL